MREGEGETHPLALADVPHERRLVVLAVLVHRVCVLVVLVLVVASSSTSHVPLDRLHLGPPRRDLALHRLPPFLPLPRLVAHRLLPRRRRDASKHGVIDKLDVAVVRVDGQPKVERLVLDLELDAARLRLRRPLRLGARRPERARLRVELRLGLDADEALRRRPERVRVSGEVRCESCARRLDVALDVGVAVRLGVGLGAAVVDLDRGDGPGRGISCGGAVDGGGARGGRADERLDVVRGGRRRVGGLVVIVGRVGLGLVVGELRVRGNVSSWTS